MVYLQLPTGKSMAYGQIKTTIIIILYINAHQVSISAPIANYHTLRYQTQTPPHLTIHPTIHPNNDRKKKKACEKNPTVRFQRQKRQKQNKTKYHDTSITQTSQLID